jgi:hypothetical protein
MKKKVNVYELENIEAQIYRLGGISINIATILGSKGTTNERIPNIYFHSYISNDKYSSKEYLQGIYLKHKYFLNFKFFGKTQTDLVSFDLLGFSELLDALNTIVSYVEDGLIFSYDQKNPGIIYLNPESNDIQVFEITGINKKSILIEYIIIDDSYPGVKISSENLSQTLFLNEFISLVSMLNKIDLFSISLNLVNFGMSNKKEYYDLEPRKLEE